MYNNTPIYSQRNFLITQLRFDAQTLNGLPATQFSLNGHTHTISEITDISNAFVLFSNNSDKLDGYDSSDFALRSGTSFTGLVSFNGSSSNIESNGNDDFTISSQASITLDIDSDNNSTNYFRITKHNKSITLLYIDDNGNIGIGTTLPSEKLHVAGNALIDGAVTQNIFNGDLNGNAYTQSKLETQRTIALSGSVNGSASFDGSSDITISTTVQNDSHTHTISTITDIANASVSYASSAGNSDKLDNLDSTQFVRSDVDDTVYGKLTIDNSITIGSAIPVYNSSITDAPGKLPVIYIKRRGYFDTIKALSGEGDYFYCLDRNPDYTVTSNYSGWEKLFNGNPAGPMYLPITNLSTNPWVLEIKKNSGTIDATDVLTLILTGYRLESFGTTFTSWKVEIILSDDSYLTVLDRDGVSDEINMIYVPLHIGSGYDYIKGIRLTVRGATSCTFYPNHAAISSLQLRDFRPSMSPAQGLGALDIRGGYMFGDVDWRYGTPKVSGNVVWHAGNDGSGSGLDADLLDGKHASDFANATHTHDYLPLSGGTLTGVVSSNSDIKTTASIRAENLYLGEAGGTVAEGNIYNVDVIYGANDIRFGVGGGIYHFLNSAGLHLGSDSPPSQTLDVEGNADISGNLSITGGLTVGGVIQTTGYNGGGIRIGNNTNKPELTTVTGDEFVIWKTKEIRFSDSTSWDYNKWAGIKYDSTNQKMYIGGPQSSQFKNNSSPPNIDVVFDGVNNVQINGGLNINNKYVMEYDETNDEFVFRYLG